MPERNPLQPLAEIKKLHSEILATDRAALQKAIRIGRLLTKIKNELPHGDWLPWLRGNVPFSQKTASNYMRIFKERDQLKLVNVTNLSAAYKRLAEANDPARYIPSWAKSAHTVDEVNDALEIVALTLPKAAERGIEVPLKERVEFLFLLLEKRLRITSEGECERFDGEKWHLVTSSLDGEGTIK